MSWYTSSHLHNTEPLEGFATERERRSELPLDHGPDEPATWYEYGGPNPPLSMDVSALPNDHHLRFEAYRYDAPLLPVRGADAARVEDRWRTEPGLATFEKSRATGRCDFTIVDDMRRKPGDYDSPPGAVR